MPEQQTFMLPEHRYYAHHPGRFVYVKDEVNGELFSVPYEPVRCTTDAFVFSVGQQDVEWRVEHNGIALRWSVSTPVDEVVELWTLEVENIGSRARRLSVYPYFTIGYMSWMNHSARYQQDLGGIVATSVSPYQKLEDYERILSLKDKTFLLHDVDPDAFETSQSAFEGEGGLHNPDGIRSDLLGGNSAAYETPLATLQYRLKLEASEVRRYKFVFGPARDEAEIRSFRDRYLSDTGFVSAREDYARFLDRGAGCLKVATPDPHLDAFVNHWLDRQVFYHGDANRLCTDPQTRNFLQDSMGMAYVQPDAAREAICIALSQQHADGEMPDGILLTDSAELKYINQVPHKDHSAWLPICIEAYLQESGDYDFLSEPIAGLTIAERITAAMRALIRNRDERGLSLIAQGDWCDPMNMVGHKGKGVSSWLSMASVHALRVWSTVLHRTGDRALAEEFAGIADEISVATRKFCWDKDWFARGITDDDVAFGVQADSEGRIFLNAQSWAVISGVANDEQQEKSIASALEHLGTAFGMMTLAPPYSKFRDDVGRLTQKFPGTAENGSIYNHDAAFFIYALYKARHADRAFEQIRHMIPGPSEADYLQRNQLPVFVPNYYRGAVEDYPKTAGRSSQLFNTGAASWLYRILVEELFGLKGVAEGLSIGPQLPSDWSTASVSRRFRHAQFAVKYRRHDEAHTQVHVDGVPIDGSVVTQIEAGNTYKVDVLIGRN
jgi:cellobionic acid phosphorylase